MTMTMTMNTRLDQSISKIQDTAKEVKHGLIEQILALPDNPNINRIGNSGNCFTISSSQLKNNMSYEYHDFKKQHEIIAVIINKKDIFDILPTLRNIIETSKYRLKSHAVNFHPDVIEQLKGILI